MVDGNFLCSETKRLIPYGWSGNLALYGTESISLEDTCVT